MAAALNAQQLAAVEQQFTQHPEILQALKTYHDWASHLGRYQYTTKGGPPNPQQVLAQYGINFPDISDYQIQVDPQGNVHFDRQNWFQRNADWIIPVSVIGGGAALGAAGVGGAATPTAPEVAISSTPITGMSAPGVVAAATGGVAPPAAAGAGGALHGLGHFLGTPAGSSLVSGGLGFLGGLLGNKNNNAFVAEQNALNRRQALATALAGADSQNQSEDLTRQQAYLNSTQMDPVHQQKELFRAGLLASLANQGPPHIGPGYTGSHYDLSGPAQQFLNPNALAENATRFYDAAGQLNPNAIHPDLSASFGSAGASRQGALDTSINSAALRMDAQRRQRRMDLLNGISDSSTRSQFGEDDYFTRRNLQGGGGDVAARLRSPAPYQQAPAPYALARPDAGQFNPDEQQYFGGGVIDPITGLRRQPRYGEPQ